MYKAYETSKQLELAKLLHDHDVHIALLQETLLTEDNQYTISGCMTTRCICKKCRGIATLIRNDVQAEVINTTRETDEEKHTDTQCIHVWPDNGKKYIIHNIYNPPSCTLNVEQDLPTHFNTIYTGDFNGHSPLWGYPDHNATGHIIEDMLTASNLILLYDVAATPTLYHRSTGTTSTPYLNLVSADIVNKTQYTVLEDIVSDHRPTLIQLTYRTMQPQRTRRWNYKKANWVKFREISDKHLQSLQFGKDSNKNYRKVCDAIKDAAKQSIPRGHRYKYKPYWTEEIAELVTQRNQARKKVERDPTKDNRANYNKVAAQVKLLTKQCKADKWKRTCKDIDLRKEGRKAWRLLHNLNGETPKQRRQPLKTDDALVTDSRKKAKEFNKHFASTNTLQSNPRIDAGMKRNLKHKERCHPPNDHSGFTQTLTMTELKAALRKLKLHKAPGSDQITNEMIINLGSNGRAVLLRLINITWKTGQLPKDWKTAVLIPLLKKNKPKSAPSSYRPISLTSCIGKLVERMINERLNWWLEHNNIITPCQATTEDQLIRLTQKIQNGFQMNKDTIAVFVDLEKAYDKVWRQGAKTINVFRAYLGAQLTICAQK